MKFQVHQCSECGVPPAVPAELGSSTRWQGFDPPWHLGSLERRGSGIGAVILTSELLW